MAIKKIVDRLIIIENEIEELENLSSKIRSDGVQEADDLTDLIDEVIHLKNRLSIIQSKIARVRDDVSLSVDPLKRVGDILKRNS